MSKAGPTAGVGTVAVAGGGIIGTSIAWRLAQRGLRVTLFDKGSIGEEASWAAAGMLSPGGEIEGPSDLACLATESRRLYSRFVGELEEATGLAIDYQECGALDLAYSQPEWDALQSRAARQARTGIRSKPVPLEDVSTFWPRVRMDGLAGAFFYSEDAIVNAREIMVALAAASQKSGVSIRQDCPVYRLHISDKEAIVESGRGRETFEAVVVAAGAWSNAIMVEGLPAPPSAEPVKGHLIGYQQPEQTCHTVVRHRHAYLLQRASGLLICGASVEHVGFDREIRSEIVASLTEQAGFVFPHLRETTPSEVWTGLRPGSEALRMGSWHSERLYLAYGHYRNGILLAPLTADRISSEITANLRKQ
ncbi:MAG: glycine oxidase ThiO [Bryobacteraceae bacterium]